MDKNKLFSKLRTMAGTNYKLSTKELMDLFAEYGSTYSTREVIELILVTIDGRNDYYRRD